MKKYKDLNLQIIRDANDLDFAHFTYQKGMCSCCYGPKDLPALYWKGKTILSNKRYYSEDDKTGIQYLLFKNAYNCSSGRVTKNSEIKNHTYIEWGFPMEKLENVCLMLQMQLGDEYEVKMPSSSNYCIEILLKGE